MFTGIIEEMGMVQAVRKQGISFQVEIAAKTIMDDVKLGDSIAVNGVCLTVSKLLKEGFMADVMAETVRKSGLKDIKPGSKVNLERAMAANGRFGGHIVSGHIDGTGEIQEVKREENAVWLQISAPQTLMKYIVEKGSIAVDGVSLTVARLTKTSFSVSLIPHTGKETILLTKGIGDVVSLESDIIGKYVEKLMNQERNTTITMDFLSQNGFI